MSETTTRPQADAHRCECACAPAEEPAATQRLARLTSREREVASLLAAGLPSKQIALALRISVMTVLAHEAHIQRKLQARTHAPWRLPG